MAERIRITERTPDIKYHGNEMHHNQREEQAIGSPLHISGEKHFRKGYDSNDASTDIKGNIINHV